MRYNQNDVFLFRSDAIGNLVRKESLYHCTICLMSFFVLSEAREIVEKLYVREIVCKTYLSYLQEIEMLFFFFLIFP